MIYRKFGQFLAIKQDMKVFEKIKLSLISGYLLAEAKYENLVIFYFENLKILVIENA